MITVERFPDVKDDAGICDVARVSFNKRASEFSDEKNKGLIKYLVNHGHWSPAGQARFTVKLDRVPAEDIDPALIVFFSNAVLAGFKWELVSDREFGRTLGSRLYRTFWLNGSVWAFAQNMRFIPPQMVSAALDHIKTQYPWFHEVTRIWLPLQVNDPVSEVVENTAEGFPIELVCASFRIKAPVYVARQLVKHQVGLTWNEVSRRYVDTPPEFYDVDKWRARPAASIKQGSGTDLEPESQEYCTNVVQDHRDSTLWVYEELLKNDVAPEQARAALTLDMMTEWIWTGGLTDFARICRDRCAPDAQYETRIVAEQIDLALELEFGEKWTKLVSKDGKRVWTGQS